jgi:hypothetical protein
MKKNFFYIIILIFLTQCETFNNLDSKSKVYKNFNQIDYVNDYSNIQRCNNYKVNYLDTYNKDYSSGFNFRCQNNFDRQKSVNNHHFNKQLEKAEKKRS